MFYYTDVFEMIYLFRKCFHFFKQILQMEMKNFTKHWNQNVHVHIITILK